jgi:flagellar hook assembly protein FlgD
VPDHLSLLQNYPNPFNPVTTLRYELSQESFVKITIYDMLGNVVNNLVNRNQRMGYKSVQWNATNDQGQPVSTGLYFYTIQAGGFIQTKKMLLLK